MTLSRRDFLRIGSLTAVAASASACSVIGRELAQQELPNALPMPTGADAGAVDPLWRLLNRAGYGPRPGDVARVQAMGIEAYIEEQLQPETIDDTAVDTMLRNLTLYHMDVSQLMTQEERDAALELVSATVNRALYSQRQLYEAMVEFWSDHFNIYLRKASRMPLLKLVDDRDVIRPHALGKFRDLLVASARSPAMLLYLDNVRNFKDSPNENYARELLELHTLGVHGGYTQTDVQEVARALTGAGVARRGRQEGQYLFTADQHDNRQKQVLGHTLPAGQGEADIEQVLQIVVMHPATADFIATKLVRRFVADDPPAALVQQVAQIYLDSDGDIKKMLRHIFLSDAFATAPPKLKRPYAYFVSALRALHTDIGLNRNNGRWLLWLGQPLFQWPAPDGYPDVASAWRANLLPRWNLALNLVHGTLDQAAPPLEAIVSAGQAATSTDVLNLFAGLLWGCSLEGEPYHLLRDYVGSEAIDHPPTRERLRDAVALMLASPAFQWT